MAQGILIHPSDQTPPPPPPSLTREEAKLALDAFDHLPGFVEPDDPTLATLLPKLRTIARGQQTVERLVMERDEAIERAENAELSERDACEAAPQSVCEIWDTTTGRAAVIELVRRAEVVRDERDALRAEISRLRPVVEAAERFASKQPSSVPDYLQDALDSFAPTDPCCDGIAYCREHNPGGRIA